jgi:hypothetical protein
MKLLWCYPRQGIVKKDIAPELNYATEADWYTVPVAARQAGWSEPYFDS